MFRKVLIVIFLMYYIAFMVLPNLPFVKYYFGQYKHRNNELVISNSDSQVLVGDICFLKALIERTIDENSNKDEAPPEANNQNTNLVYIISDLLGLNDISVATDIMFQNNKELLTYRYLKIPSPPPKYFS